MNFKKSLFTSVLLTIILLAIALMVVNIFNMFWASPMLVSLVLLFGAEILHVFQGRVFVLGILAKLTDKLVFCISFSLFWILTLLPRITHMGRLSELMFMLLGLFMGILNFVLFASQDAKRKLTSRS